MTERGNRGLDLGSLVLMAPAVAILMVFMIGASVLLVFYSLTDWRGFGAMEYVGLDNYVRLAQSGQFQRSLSVTLVFTVVFVLCVNALGLLLAVLVAQPGRLNAFYRALFFFPMILPTVAVGFIWKRMFEPGGAVPVLFSIFGEEPRILAIDHLAVTATIWTAVWQTTGFVVVLLIARIVTIPKDLYEAAAMDGAKSWTRFRFVTLPMLIPTLFVSIVFTTVIGLREYDRPIALTGGGPARATEMVAMRIMDDAFQRGSFGMAAAQAVTLMLLTATVAGLLMWIGRCLESEP